MTRRPVTATAWLEIDADEARYVRVIPRDPWAPMVTARWRPRWSWARTWRHRERVRPQALAGAVLGGAQARSVARTGEGEFMPAPMVNPMPRGVSIGPAKTSTFMGFT